MQPMTRATDPAARPDPLRDGLVAVLGAAAVAAGAEGAWSNGIEPFLTGALVKSVAAAIVVACARRLSGLGACRAT